MARRALCISSVETALRIYYTKTEMDTTDIKELFGISNSDTVCRLKKQARAVMKEKEAQCWNANSVDTECAFIAWKLDIGKLEKMHSKLKKLEIAEVDSA